MAESIVSYAIKKLDAFLDAEVKLQRGLKRELVSLQNELASINVVLKDAGSKAYERDDIKEWIRQVRGIAYQIEDVIDEYLALQQNGQSSSGLLKAFWSVRELKPRHQLATTINDIKVELAEIQRRKNHYKLDSTVFLEEPKKGCQDYHSYYSTYMDSELFGNDKSISDIITMLKMEHHPYSQFVIAIVGMGGVGKTSLVQKLYEDKEVRKDFGLYAFISVSRSYKNMDVLMSILKQWVKATSHGRNDLTTSEVDRLPHDHVVQNLRDFLREHKNQRYLLILDDVWDTELLDYIRDSLPSHVDGKILITTRHRDVARAWTTSLPGHVHELQPLPPNKAWNLFCIKTFRNRACPQELEGLYRQIVDKCEGLPLAIVMIAGFLNSKQCDYPYLSKLLNSLGSEFTSNRELTRLRKILFLSYHELPSFLKPCYLYFGMLPNAYAITHRRLIRMWMADGLVEPQRGKTPEDIGEEYLVELIERNLVQVTLARPTGRHTCVRAHDVLREIIISELEETGFGKLVSNDNLLSMSNHFHRLAIRSSNDNNKMLKMIANGSKYRCLAFMGDNAEQEMPKALAIRSLIKVVPLLKVLDLEDAPICEIPEEVGNLGLLCLLNLRKTNVRTLPKSIGRLVNLETLDMRYCPILELPKEMNHLHKLRYLHAYHSDYDSNKGVGVHIPTGVLKNLEDLQKLTMIDITGETAQADAEMIIEEVSKLKQLRKLGITFRMENGIEVSSMVKEMKHLESLLVKSAHKDDKMDLELDGAKNSSLQCLYMFRGILHKLPDWVGQLNNLVSFGLKHSRLEEDPLPLLGRLPNLVQLYLMDDAYVGAQLGFGRISGFQKLQALRIRGLKALYMIKGSPPPLVRQGFIFRCPKLKYVPSELQFLIWSSN